MLLNKQYTILKHDSKHSNQEVFKIKENVMNKACANHRIRFCPIGDILIAQ